MATMGIPEVYRPLNWMDVGEPPAAVQALRDAQNRKVVGVVTHVMPPVIAAVAGFFALFLLPGPLSWTLAAQVELFFAVAIPVGVGSYIFQRWYVRFIAKYTQYHPKRVAIEGPKLVIDLGDGKTYDYSFKNLGVSDQPLAEDWYTVGISGGRFIVTFYVPAQVAAYIRAAKQVASA